MSGEFSGVGEGVGVLNEDMLTFCVWVYDEYVCMCVWVCVYMCLFWSAAHQVFSIVFQRRSLCIVCNL